MDHCVTLVFEDETAIPVRVGEGETVLDAAWRQGVYLLAGCQSGSCGTCKARCLEGRYTSESFQALPRFQIQQGWVLTCTMRVQSDCRMQLPYDRSRCAVPKDVSYSGTVSDVAMVSASVARLEIVLEGDQRFVSFRRV